VSECDERLKEGSQGGKWRHGPLHRSERGDWAGAMCHGMIARMAWCGIAGLGSSRVSSTASAG
jgi:hypothetical protein